MTQTYNIYCDESCHLENDHEPIMVLGAISCIQENVRSVSFRIKEIKEKHGLSAMSEVKWTKVSPSKVALYLDLVDYFFDDDDLNFRAVVCDKNNLNHHEFRQNHDDWYYKMYYQLLHRMLSDRHHFRIYLDIKDSRSAYKAQHLKNILCNDHMDFNHNMLESLQHIRSHEVQLMQVVDILIGAIAYVNRHKDTSVAKMKVIDRIRHRSHLSLLKTNYSTKLNLFHWQGRVA